MASGLQETGRRARAKSKDATVQQVKGTLTCHNSAQCAEASRPRPLLITLNGEPHTLDGPLSVADLLTRLSIDPRRVAVEHNFAILKRRLFAVTLINEGDRIEIVNFVGGG